MERSVDTIQADARRTHEMAVADSNATEDGGNAGRVTLESVTKYYGEVPAVDRVSMQIEAGEFVSLLGPSGAGKSSLLRIIGGFERPEAGKVYLGTEDITHIPPHKRHVNTVFQHYALFPHMTVGENVVYGLRQDKVPRPQRGPRVREALEMVQMLDLADRKPSELSGGQQQRVALARALIKQPKVLLLDEPLGALDLKLRQQMQIELKRLHREFGITFVYVTHDQGEALAMSDRIAVMRDGGVEQIAEREELYDRPGNSFVADFVGSQNFFEGVARRGGHELVTEAGVVLKGDRATGDIEEGATVRAGVRPEHVVLEPSEGAGGVNRLEGVVREIVHSGDSLEFVVRLESGRDIFSRIPRVQSPNFERGTRVVATWSVSRLTIFHR